MSLIPRPFSHPAVLFVAMTVSGLATLVALGCGPSEVLGRVHGVVTFQGQPVAKALVLFQNPELGVYMTAEVDEQGRFGVDMAKGRGLPLGTYQISVTPPIVDFGFGPPPAERPADTRPDIPARYRDPKTSGLTLTVTEGDNPCDIQMVP